jgi:hypothetical protein
MIWTFACGLTQDASALAKMMIDNTTIDAHHRAILLADVLVQGATLTRPIFEQSCGFIRANLEDLASRLETESSTGPESQSVVRDGRDVEAGHSITKLLETLATPGPLTSRSSQIARILLHSGNPRVAKWASGLDAGTLREELRLLVPARSRVEERQ